MISRLLYYHVALTSVALKTLQIYRVHMICRSHIHSFRSGEQMEKGMWYDPQKRNKNKKILMYKKNFTNQNLHSKKRRKTVTNVIQYASYITNSSLIHLIRTCKELFYWARRLVSDLKLWVRNFRTCKDFELFD